MDRLRGGRPGAIGAAAQEQEQSRNRRGQRPEDRRQFGGGAERYKMREDVFGFDDTDGVPIGPGSDDIALLAAAVALDQMSPDEGAVDA